MHLARPRPSLSEPVTTFTLTDSQQPPLDPASVTSASALVTQVEPQQDFVSSPSPPVETPQPNTVSVVSSSPHSWSDALTSFTPAQQAQLLSLLQSAGSLPADDSSSSTPPQS